MFDVVGEPGCEELSEVVALMDAPLEPGWVVVDDGDGLGGPGRPVGWVLGPGLTSTVLLEDPAARESGTSCAVGDGGVEIVDEMFLYRCDRGRGVVLDHGVDVVRGVRGGQSTGGLVSEMFCKTFLGSPRMEFEYSSKSWFRASATSCTLKRPSLGKGSSVSAPRGRLFWVNVMRIG
jgi:hypothetical protein